MATVVVSHMLTSPRDDAQNLYRAVKGLGCDTASVINILAHRDAGQRALIQQEYRILYSEDLIARLTSELHGDCKRAVTMWMPDPATRDATIIRQSLTSLIINDLKAVTEVICSRTPSQIHQLRQIYYTMYAVYLETDVEYNTIGDHQKLLLQYITSSRYEGPEVDFSVVDHDARVLYKAGEDRLGTDENSFITIFSQRSQAHLVAVSSAYQNLYGNSLDKAIKSETSGLFEFGLLTILRCAINPVLYFAKALHKSMKGLGTDETRLSRVIVTRAEVDLQYIKAEYYRKYGETLYDAIYDDTSGSYRNFLLALLGPN